LQTLALIETVTTGIAKAVQRLQDLGLNGILVNNMHPLGCTPFRTRPNNYTRCDDVANAVAATHNKLLAEKLALLEIRTLPSVYQITLGKGFVECFFDSALSKIYLYFAECLRKHSAKFFQPLRRLPLTVILPRAFKTLGKIYFVS
jgi:hypothetical protein